MENKNRKKSTQISVPYARKILGKNYQTLTDGEVSELITMLYTIAETLVKYYGK